MSKPEETPIKEFNVPIKMNDSSCTDLRVQKQALIEALYKNLLPESIQGIVHLLDHIQDHMVEEGHFPEEVIFGEPED